MKNPLYRLSGVLAVSGLLVAAASPAAAIDLRDVLDQILGRSGSKDGFSLVEAILRSELPRRVGPARRWDVKLDRAGSDLLRGRLSKVDVHGFDVRTQDGLGIPELDMTLQDVRLGLASRSLESVGKSEFTAGLGAAAITAFVKHRGGPKLKDVRVKLERGEIMVGATPEVMGFGLPSEVSGKPVLKGADAINFEASRLTVFGVRLPALAVEALERKINPVVDLSGLKVPVRVTDLRVQGDRLLAEGAALFGPSRGRGVGR